MKKDTLLYAPFNAAKSASMVHHYDGDAGYDLVSSASIRLEPGTFGQISTNICVALPEGCWGMVVGRSSTAKRNLIVVPGIIDNGWRGELFAVIFNPTDSRITIESGDRIVQLIVFNLVNPNITKLEDASKLPNGARGTKGFGSTGV